MLTHGIREDICCSSKDYKKFSISVMEMLPKVVLHCKKSLTTKSTQKEATIVLKTQLLVCHIRCVYLVNRKLRAVDEYSSCCRTPLGMANFAS